MAQVGSPVLGPLFCGVSLEMAACNLGHDDAGLRGIFPSYKTSQ